VSDTDPTIDASKPVPNAWKEKDVPPWAWGVASFVACIVIGIVLAYAISRSTIQSAQPAPIVQAPPPPSHTVIEYIESTGGKEHVKGNATGASLSLSGEKVEAKDMVIAPTDMTLFDVGSLTGGAFSGSFKASVSGQLWIRIIFALLALAAFALAVLSFKKNPLDWHCYGGLALGGVLCVVVVADPTLLYVGLAGVAIAAALNFLPSRTATKTIDAAQWYDDFTQSDPDVSAKWLAFRAKMPAAAKSVIDNLIKKTNV